MAGGIIVLDAVTAGRIAAGEVVERPASVVKELVENSLDAGATRIEVEIESGGLDLIKVTDDGVGMSPCDAALAFERHATSKLRRAEDLNSLTTLGFRGEALPSVGAVSKMRLVTAVPGAAEGAEVRYEGGRLVSVGPAAPRTGTVVWVRDLFFNTPARREAARSPRAETARVAEVVATLALAAPGVAFSFEADAGLEIHTPGTGRLEDAAAGVFGARFTRELVGVAYTFGKIGVTGLVGLPAVARRDGRRQYLFCNGRPVSPHILRSATERAYSGLLQAGQTPVFILNVNLPTESVDVNIHPAKTFVRFQEHGLVHQTVVSAIKAALGERDLFPGRLTGRLAPPAMAAGPAARETAAGRVPGDWRLAFDQGWEGYGQRVGAVRGSGVPGAVREGEYPMAAGEGEFPGAVREGEVSESEWGTTLPASAEPLGQIGGLFIIARAPEGLFVIDQHAAHERVVFERLTAGTGADATLGPGIGGASAPPASQLLAVPETLDIPAAERSAFTAYLPFLAQVGFDLEEFGERGATGVATVIIRAVPAALAGVPARRLLGDFADRLSRSPSAPGSVDGASGREGVAELLRAAKTLAACKAALKAGEAMSTAEMAALIRDLAGAREPRTCPHGRPTYISLTVAELGRAFSRSRAVPPAGAGR